MSDPALALRRKSYAAFLAAGLASSLLYLSVFLSFAFLVPVRVAVFGRSGRRAGGIVAGLAAVGHSGRPRLAARRGRIQ